MSVQAHTCRLDGQPGTARRISPWLKKGPAQPPRRGVYTAVRCFKADKPTLFDVPVSNNGARCRFVIYSKGLQQEIAIKSPKELGGLKSDEYLALHPQGKMPLLVLPDGCAIPESEVISAYICDRWSDTAPSLRAPTPEMRAKAACITRTVDVYITPVQGAMYRQMGVQERAAGIKEIARQLDVLERQIVGPLAVSDNITTADAAVFPTIVFCDYMLPQFFGWQDIFAQRPKLGAWWGQVQQDSAAQQVKDELVRGLDKWREQGRWQDTGVSEHVQDDSFQWAY